MADTQTLSERLREAAKGRHVWRVRNKKTKAWCMEFADYEKLEADEWWKTNSSQFPEYHKDNELARVHLLSSVDKLMLEAADIIDGHEMQRSDFE